MCEDRLCVDKLWVDKLSKWCDDKLCRRREADHGPTTAGGRQRDTESKPRTPHKDVVKKPLRMPIKPV